MFITSVIGMAGVASGMEGYMLTRMNWIERILVVGGGLLMIDPGMPTDIIGFVIIVLVGVFQFFKRKGQAAAITGNP